MSLTVYDVQGRPKKSVRGPDVPMDKVHVVGAAGEPAFQSGFSSGSEQLRFRKDPFGKVWVRGTLSGGSANVAIFTLPPGYRPVTTLYFDTLRAGGASGGYVYVDTGGVVASVTTDAYIDVSFDTESVLAMPGPPASQGSPPLVVTALPTVPYDGQEVYYRADATNGVLWHLRYNAAGPAGLRWEMVGGPSLIAENRGNQTATAGAWVAGTPSIALPLPGTYEVSYTTAMNTSTGGAAQGYVGLYFGGVRDDNGVLGIHSPNAAVATSISSSDYPKTIAAPTTMQFGFYCSAANVYTSTVIAARPRRVG